LIPPSHLIFDNCILSLGQIAKNVVPIIISDLIRNLRPILHQADCCICKAFFAVIPNAIRIRIVKFSAVNHQ